MKNAYFFLQIFPLAFALTFFIACSGQVETNTIEKSAETTTPRTKVIGPLPSFHLGPWDHDTTLISQYIRSIFQDSKGNYWFGPASESVARYDGETLKYFTKAEFFQGNDLALAEDGNGHSVHAIAEDKEGNLWFATFEGAVKYDGKTFKSYTEKDGLSNTRIGRKSILVDRSGTVWVGTEGEGIFRYDSSIDKAGMPSFSHFDLIPPMISKDIMEDKDGNLWFASKNKGIFRYDGNEVINFTEQAGLGNNYGGGMAQDKEGNYWFTIEGGITKYDGKTFTNFTSKDVLNGSGSEVWGLIIEEQSGIIWVSARGSMTRFDPSIPSSAPKAVRVYTPNEEGGINCCVQSMYQDQQGNVWWGAGQGVYRYDGEGFYQVKQDGPW